MKQLIAILIAAFAIASCSETATDTTGTSSGASSVGTPGAFDACSCTQYLDGNSPEYMKCKELRKADPKFEADFQMCAVAAKSGMDTNQVKLKKAEEMSKLQQTQSGSFQFDAQKSKVIWRGEKITGKTHKGTVNVVEGVFEYNGTNITSGSIAIDMTSLKVTGEDASSASKLEGHLKSADFFDVSAHPKAKFEVISSAQQSELTHKVKGRLSIKGISEEVTADLVLAPSGAGMAVGGSLIFNRAKFNVRYGSGSFFENLGNDAIKDEVMLTFELQAVKK